MLYVPAVVTVAVMVCVTPLAATPVVRVPEDPVLQFQEETIAVPLVDGCPAKKLKEQLGVVFNV
jgi:hypothetical protein